MTSPRTLRNFIGGAFVDGGSGATSDVVNPATGQVVARAPLSGAEEVDAAYEAADRAFGEWGRTTPSERQQALLKIADTIEDHAEELIALESENTGKIKALTASEEIPPMVDQLRFFAGAARILEGKAAGEYMAGHTSWIRREPIGVVGQVTPWNYPLLMAVWKIGPALAAGNTVVLKPSDTTPESTLRLAELAAEHLPAGTLNVVTGDRETGRLLVEHRTPGLVAITGSVRAGRRGGRQRGARTSRGCTSSSAARPPSSSSTTPTSRPRSRASRSPATSTPARTAPRPPACSPRPASTTTSSRPSSDYARSSAPVGLPDDEDALFGPVNNARQLAHVSGFIDHLPSHATVSAGGNRRTDLGDGFYLEPTVLSGLRQDDDAIQNEIFGPVITVQRFTDEAEAVRLGQRRRLRPGVVGVDQGLRARDAHVEGARLRLRVDQHPHPAGRGDAARRLQEVRLRQGPVDVRLRGLHAHQARDGQHRELRASRRAPRTTPYHPLGPAGGLH